MTPRTVNIVCAKSKVPCVPAVRYHVYPGDYIDRETFTVEQDVWLCSYCDARVKVVA